MKITKTKTTKLLLSCLLATSLTGEFAMASEEINSNEKAVKGTTIGFKHCVKPGAPVDMTFNTERVALNETAEVSIALSTTLQSGEMEVTITLDEELTTIGEAYNSINFSISPSQKEYNIDLKVSAAQDGLYYVRLLTKVDGADGTRMRAFAVPIYVGNGKLKKKSNQVIMKAVSGENLSISKAEETIETIQE